MKPNTYILVALLTGLLASGCTHPHLVERKEHSATVQVENASGGYANVMVYHEPLTCEGPQVLGSIFQPYQSREHLLAAGETTTLSVAAWGLPSEPQKVAWCPPIFISFKLNEDRAYRLRFVVDYSAKKCALRLSDRVTEAAIPTKQFEGTGGLFPGVMAGPISCKPKQQL
jgi:hypothetical protein